MSLEQAIRTDGRSVVSLLADMSERERRVLAPVAIESYQTWNKNIGQDMDGVATAVLAVTTTLAMLGTASLTELKKARIYGSFDSDLGLELLRSREPAWLQSWCEWVLSTAPTRWPFVRLLQQNSLIGELPTELFVLGMIVGARRHGAHHLLTSDRDLLQQVPHLFTVEGGGENSLAAFDKYCGEASTWAWALRTLAEEGTLQRADLLRWSLEALQRDFANFRAGWFSRFHESMKPSIGERNRLSELYLSLLHSQVKPTVGFALKALKELAKTTDLPPEALSDGLRGVWMSSNKGTVKAGIKLLKKLPSEGLITEHLTEVLLHPEPSLAGLALKELRKLHPQPPQAWRARWLELSEMIPATLRDDWNAWIGNETTFDSCESTQQFERPSGPLKVEPCQSQDEVVQLAAQLLENMEPAWQLERVLDGILRFPRPNSQLVPALKKRVEQRLRTRHATRSLASVFAVWVGESYQGEREFGPDFRGFLEKRLAEIKDVLVERNSTELLSLPEETNGEISAETLVRRLRRVKPRPMDLAQAILRLKPTTNLPSTGEEKLDQLLAFALGKLDKDLKRSLWPFANKDPYTCCWEVAQARRYFEKKWSWQWSVTRRDSEYDGKIYTHRYLNLAFEPVPPETLLWSASVTEEETRGWRAWESVLFPAARSRWLLRGVDALSNNIDWWEARWADIVFLEQLEHFCDDWGELEALMVAFGLGCKEKGQAGLTQELVARALGTGQLSAELLGNALSRCAKTEMVKMNRWARALTELALFAPLPELCLAFEILFDDAFEKVNLSKLVPSYLELVAKARYKPTAPKFHEWLKTLKGQGVSASAARKLLKHFGKA